ncbi:MAG: TonB-dependent receptor domain-containing protein [Lishizhenia sp.]
MRTLFLILFLLVAVLSSAQTIKGRIVDENTGRKIPLLVKVENINTKVVTGIDSSGIFEIKAKRSHFLRITCLDYDTLKIKSNWTEEVKLIKLKPSFLSLEGIDILAKRYEDFGITIAPIVTKTRINYGKGELLLLKSTSGAQSKGNPREMFAKVPGLNIWESDGAGIQIGIGGRGLSPNRTANFNTRQNGYDISADALGYPESYYTPPIEALEAIQITRGSASLQFGTQFGGLLNFKIKEADRERLVGFTSRTTAGSYGYLGTFNRLEGGKGRFYYQTYHQYKRGDGYRPNGKFNQHQFFAQLGYNFSEKLIWKLEYTKMTYNAQQSGGLTDFQFNDDPLQSNRERNWFRVDWNLLASHLDYSINDKTHFNFRAFGMISERQSLGFLGKINQNDIGGKRQLISGEFKNVGAEARLMRKYHINTKSKKINGALLFGARYYQGNTLSEQGLASDDKGADFNFISNIEPENSSFNFPSQNIALFVDHVLFLNRFAINTGIRYDHISSASEGYYYRYNLHPILGDTLDVFKINDSRSTPRNVLLGGIGVSYGLKNNNRIYLNASQNYRAINFNDIRINNPNVIIDSLIKDEYGATFEVGYKGLVDNFLFFDVGAFYIFYGDKIGLATQGIKKIRTNIGDAQNFGIEAVVELDFLKLYNKEAKYGLSVFGNFAFIQANYVRSKESSIEGRQVEYVAPIIARGGIKFKSDKLNIQLQGSYTDEQFSDATNAIQPSGDAVIGLIPSYFVADISAAYMINSNFKIETGVNNALNNQYFTRRATAYPGPGIIPADGISFYLTLQINLKSKK